MNHSFRNRTQLVALFVLIHYGEPAQPSHSSVTGIYAACMSCVVVFNNDVVSPLYSERCPSILVFRLH